MHTQSRFPWLGCLISFNTFSTFNRHFAALMALTVRNLMTERSIIFAPPTDFGCGKLDNFLHFSFVFFLKTFENLHSLLLLLLRCCWAREIGKLFFHSLFFFLVSAEPRLVERKENLAENIKKLFRWIDEIYSYTKLDWKRKKNKLQIRISWQKICIKFGGGGDEPESFEFHVMRKFGLEKELKMEIGFGLD